MTFLTNEAIEKAASDFLKKHHPSNSLPIPVEEIACFELNMRIVPVGGMKKHTGVDGCISKDLKCIYIDDYQYMNSEFRSRFTIAHEIGHHVLHGSYISSLNVTSEQNWKQLVLSNKKTWGSMEYQAYMFAGYLLMPSDLFKREYESLDGESSGTPNEFNIIRELAKKFHVSDEAAEKRLRNFLRNKS